MKDSDPWEGRNQVSPKMDAKDEEKLETVTDIFLGSRITVDGDYSHNVRHVLLRRKAMTNLNSILKSRDITLLIMFRI